MDTVTRKVRDRNRTGEARVKNVRDRIKVDIPFFEINFNFLKYQLRYDKIEINFDLAVIGNSQREAVINHFRRIASNSCFLVHEGTDRNPQLKIRKTSNRELTNGRVVEDLLFSGYIGVIQSYDRSDTIKIRAFININPTRYFVHNAERNISYQAQKLLANDAARVNAQMRSYGTNDNLISDELLSQARHTNWNNLVMEYLSLIREKLQSEMQVNENDIIQYSEYYDQIENWTIGHSEHYWEFKTDDDCASDITHDFCEYLKSRFLQLKKNYYLNAADYSYDNVSYTFQTSKKNVDIAVYAKSHNRIRVECRFNSRPKSIYSGEFGGEEYDATHEENITNLLDALTRKSQGLCRIISKHKKTFKCSNEDRDINAIADILAGIAHEAENNVIYYRRMLRSLRDCGKIIEEENEVYNRFLVRLKNRGILQQIPKERGKPRMYYLNYKFTL